mgnify:CR=1 FL=1
MLIQEQAPVVNTFDRCLYNIEFIISINKNSIIAEVSNTVHYDGYNAYTVVLDTTLRVDYLKIIVDHRMKPTAKAAYIGFMIDFTDPPPAVTSMLHYCMQQEGNLRRAKITSTFYCNYH